MSPDSCLTISGAAAGSYSFEVVGTSTTSPKSDSIDLSVGAGVPPSAMVNNTAVDSGGCADSGVLVSWSQDPGDWGDGGAGTRTYDVLRDSTPIQSALAYGTTSYTDTTGATGVTYTYSVQYNNGCGFSSATAGTAAADSASAAVPASLRVVDVHPCEASGLRVSWEDSANATGYDLRVDGTTVISDVTSPYAYDPGDMASHGFEVRAKNPGCGPSAWSASVAGSDGTPPADILFCDGFESGDTVGWDYPS